MKPVSDKRTKQYCYSILQPGGNNTMLIKGIPEKKLRKSINDTAMKQYSKIEQVGFYTYSPFSKSGRLEMAGGEFCGNALRSLACILLRGKKGEIPFQVSGVNRLLRAGVKNKDIAYAEMPIKETPFCISKLTDNLWQIDLEGISHLIKPSVRKLGEKNAKILAKKILKKTGLQKSKPAAGVIFVQKAESDNRLCIEPVVWVRDIQTFFYETACASGTAAVGIWKSFQVKNPDVSIFVRQPSGCIIKANIKKNKTKLISVFIEGTVKILIKKGVLSL